MINQVPTFRLENMPYGGVKDSGQGREGVRFAIEEMTELRTLVIRTLTTSKERGAARRIGHAVPEPRTATGVDCE